MYWMHSLLAQYALAKPGSSSLPANRLIRNVCGLDLLLHHQDAKDARKTLINRQYAKAPRMTNQKQSNDVF
jgi:hypothetical protein